MALSSDAVTVDCLVYIASQNLSISAALLPHCQISTEPYGASRPVGLGYTACASHSLRSLRSNAVIKPPLTLASQPA